MDYDNSLRDLIEGRPQALADFVLGIDPANAGARYGATELPGEPLRTDSILEFDVPAGGVRCVHVEFQYRANATDIEPRLVAYWARLNMFYGSAPDQCVVVLDRRGGRLKGKFQRGGLTLRYRAIHLWEVPATELLRLDTLYPLAVLGATEDRESVFVDVARRARGEDGRRAERVLQNTATLANLYLSPLTLELLLRRADMPLDLRELPMIQDARREGIETGIEIGIERGMERGIERGRQESRLDLLGLASEKFGPLSEALAELVLDASREFASVNRAVALATSAEELHASLRGGDQP
jgi:predicted transposase YdaD